MVASEMIKKLEALIAEYGDQPLVYASDDEGNDFHELWNNPKIGRYDRRDREFNETVNSVNAICVN